MVNIKITIDLHSHYNATACYLNVGIKLHAVVESQLFTQSNISMVVRSRLDDMSRFYFKCKILQSSKSGSFNRSISIYRQPICWRHESMKFLLHAINNKLHALLQ
jgi:hypothetical protein